MPPSTSPLLTVIPLSAADLPLSTFLLQHLTHLGPIPLHAVLFIADHGLTRDQLTPLADLAKPIFQGGGNFIHTPMALSNLTYPHGHNFRFETAAKHIAAHVKAPWLWMDPRCVPTRRGWLMELETEYFAHAHKHPLLGQLLTPEVHGTAAPLISATAVYPAELPKRVLQRLVSQRGTDFERSCADLLVPMAHPSKLIWVHVVDGKGALPSPPSHVTLVHTARAREYAAVVRGEPVTPVALPPAPVTDPSPTPPAPARTSYYHSGNLGDVIYALAAIQLAGGGRLLIGPTQRRTSPAGNPIKEPAYELLRPLLEAQPYVTGTAYSPRHPGTDAAFDLNHFRDHWNDKALRARINVHTLVAMHCHTLRVLEKWRPEQSWLTAPSPIATGLFTIHRSARYRSDGDSAFPWPLVVKRFKGKLLFVGQPAEHAEFQRTWGTRTAFWQCQDFLELARVIAGSLGFIGNQSFPCAIALGLGQRVLQENFPPTPDCLLPRPNFLTQPFTEAALAKWETIR